MKRTLITLSLALTTLFASAQTDSVETFRFTYELKDINEKDRSYNDRLNLDIQQGASIFYSQYTQPIEIDLTSGSVDAIFDKLEKTKKGTSAVIYKNERENVLLFRTASPDNFYFTEEMVWPQWTVVDDSVKTVAGYDCKMAKAEFCGREWIAWFTEDLPLNNGPWKLGGLPGLILKACDSENYFDYECIGIERLAAAKVKKPETKDYIKCSNKDYQKQLRLHAANPVGYALRKLGIDEKDAEIIDGDKNSKKEKKKVKVFIEKQKGDKK